MALRPAWRVKKPSMAALPAESRVTSASAWSSRRWLSSPGLITALPQVKSTRLTCCSCSKALSTEEKPQLSAV